MKEGKKKMVPNRDELEYVAERERLIVNLERSLEGEKAITSKLSGEVQVLTEELEEKRNYLVGALNEVKELTTRSNELERSLHNSELDNRNLKKWGAEKDTSITNLQSRIGRLERENELFSDRVTSLNKIVEDLNKANDELQESKSELNSKLVESSDYAQSLRERLDNATSAAEHANELNTATCDELRESMAKLEAEKIELRNEEEALRLAVDMLRAENERLKLSVEDLSVWYNNASTLVSEQSVKLTTFEVENNRMTLLCHEMDEKILALGREIDSQRSTYQEHATRVAHELTNARKEVDHYKHLALQYSEERNTEIRANGMLRDQLDTLSTELENLRTASPKLSGDVVEERQAKEQALDMLNGANLAASNWREELTNLRSEYNELAGRNARLLVEREKAREDVERLENEDTEEFKDLESKLKKALSENIYLLERLHDTQCELEKIRDSYAGVSNELSQAERDRDSAKANSSNMTSEWQRACDEHAKLQSSYDTLEETLAKSDKSLSEARSELSSLKNKAKEIALNYDHSIMADRVEAIKLRDKIRELEEKLNETREALDRQSQRAESYEVATDLVTAEQHKKELSNIERERDHWQEEARFQHQALCNRTKELEYMKEKGPLNYVHRSFYNQQMEKAHDELKKSGEDHANTIGKLADAYAERELVQAKLDNCESSRKSLEASVGAWRDHYNAMVTVASDKDNIIESLRARFEARDLYFKGSVLGFDLGLSESETSVTIATRDADGNIKTQQADIKLGAPEPHGHPGAPETVTVGGGRNVGKSALGIDWEAAGQRGMYLDGEKMRAVIYDASQTSYMPTEPDRTKKQSPFLKEVEKLPVTVATFVETLREQRELVKVWKRKFRRLRGESREQIDRLESSLTWHKDQVNTLQSYTQDQVPAAIQERYDSMALELAELKMRSAEKDHSINTAAVAGIMSQTRIQELEKSLACSIEALELAAVDEKTGPMLQVPRETWEKVTQERASLLQRNTELLFEIDKLGELVKHVDSCETAVIHAQLEKELGAVKNETGFAGRTKLDLVRERVKGIDVLSAVGSQGNTEPLEILLEKVLDIIDEEEEAF